MNLCPFAKSPFKKGRIRFVLETTADLPVLMETFVEEMGLLKNKSPKEVETTLIIHPNVLTSFEEYNNCLQLFESLIYSLRLDGFVQLASFHPQYQFDETGPEDVQNYTNRSPFPMLHLIREDSITRVVDTHPAIDDIPEQNIKKMKELGLEKIKEILDGL